MTRFSRLASVLWGFFLFCALPAGAGEFRLLVLDKAFVKWGEPVLGTGATVTYAFAARETVNEDARNCRHMTAFSDLSSSAHLPLAALKDETREAFQTWEKVSGLRFHEADRADAADIVIGIQANPTGLAFTDVAPAKAGVVAASLKWMSFGGSGAKRVATIRRSLICLNPQQVWKIGFDGNTTTYDVRYAMTHEIGHAIGLDHPGASGALMGFRYSEKARGLQSGDIEAARTLYGP